MLAPGKAFADRFPYDSRNARVALVVCLMKNHVSKLALVHKLTAFRALIEVFYFLMFIYDGKSLGVDATLLNLLLLTIIGRRRRVEPPEDRFPHLLGGVRLA
jgi:hypothetical protein